MKKLILSGFLSLQQCSVNAVITDINRHQYILVHMQALPYEYSRRNKHSVSVLKVLKKLRYISILNRYGANNFSDIVWTRRLLDKNSDINTALLLLSPLITT